ncbi:zinc metalloprotease [Acrocarpospora pleiomorpha]|uniref:Zinc metalloprotease n=1 Tax=Acrocarpospora pleiomorpha TaxID=90975 RepID=A0A5M3X920_9ACTN|nr:zinc metalloprotease [Acrocarpospora pleiomorpha]
MRLGTIAKVPIGVHWSVLLILILLVAVLGTSVLPAAGGGDSALVYGSVAVLTALLFLASLLAHEIAHLLVARRTGVGATSVTLWLLGGVTELKGEARTPRAELAIAVAGPLASFAVSAVGFLLVTPLRGVPVARTAMIWLATMNLLLGAFNLLPGAPLDGGRVLHALIWHRTRDRAQADRRAAGAGKILGGLLVSLGAAQLLLWPATGGLWTIIIGVFLAVAAHTQLLQQQMRDALAGMRVRDVMTPDPAVAPGWIDIDRFVSSVASRSHQTAFPVVDTSGAPIGYLRLQAFQDVPPARRGETRVDSLARRLPPGRVLSPEQEASVLLDPPLTGDALAVVVEDGRIVGTVTGADLARMIQLIGLRRPGVSGPPTKSS